MACPDGGRLSLWFPGTLRGAVEGGSWASGDGLLRAVRRTPLRSQVQRLGRVRGQRLWAAGRGLKLQHFSPEGSGGGLGRSPPPPKCRCFAFLYGTSTRSTLCDCGGWGRGIGRQGHPTPCSVLPACSPPPTPGFIARPKLQRDVES